MDTASAPTDAGPADAEIPEIVRFGVSVDSQTLPGGFSVKIDGEELLSLTKELSWDDYIAASSLVEVYHEASSALVFAQEVYPFCLDGQPSNTFVEDAQTRCLLPSGQLGPILTGGCVDTAGTVTVADGTCASPCNPIENDCLGSEHCGPVLALDEPLLIQLQCVPEGVMDVGDSCVYEGVGTDAHSSCKDGLGCVDGFCRLFCRTDGSDCGEGEVCQVAGGLEWADGLGVCEATML